MSDKDEKMQRTTIRLDDKLFENTKKYALSHGLSFTAVVEEALREKISKRPKHLKKQPIKLKTVKGKGVYPGVDLDDSAALLDVMES